jgi:hypothetical protein
MDLGIKQQEKFARLVFDTWKYLFEQEPYL